MTQLHYRRVLLKLSGEALMGQDAFGINQEAVANIVQEIKQVVALGVEIALVVGGGNIFRGVSIAAGGIERSTADYMGMLATIMNALALNESLSASQVPARIQSALNLQQVVEAYAQPKALQYLEEGKVVIFAGGTGNPFFTTDTAAALSAAEMKCDVLIKATQVDGVYDRDPQRYKGAIKYDHISFDEVISKQLQVMDATAFTLCRERKMDIIVYRLTEPGALKNIILGHQKTGTLVHD